ncbi:prion-inhibition and propagation-domain-containing protein [Achaetomium macrosporum]|uniref:Prion-inhibition and propagation-domain-containing protein n=1 Tax=Achaetomium macrosporum TaxID=79813 RepID=A0AAN7C668_9PEZI|nr:prion-inhibition and propagation-domain-containing protein [Achaetomium macrosporum]
MAEIAGLAVGVDVVDLYSLFVDSKLRDRDYEILETKLDIEKRMLLDWADRVCLLDTDCDPRLQAPDTRETVYRALNCIRSLLSDASKLKARYGVHIWPFEQSALSTRTEITAQGDSKRAISTRFSTIRDKQRFETLLKQLSYFTTALNELFPATGYTRGRSGTSPIITQSELRSMLDLRGLNIVLEASRGLNIRSIANTAQHAIHEACQDKILEKLWFRTMTAREDEIKEALSQTMEWALESPGRDAQWDDLPAWLRSAEGIYWVYGKAGSGNVTYSLFFWNLGTPEQKTQEGLCRSLLYQVLSQRRALIPEALEGMWKELSQTEGDVSLPSLSETRRAFRIIASRSDELGKFCLFIDGLDEVTGNYQDAISFITELNLNANIKAVVSSRPIPACIAAFGDRPKLRLHDLTRPDIRTYVHKYIGGHEYMAALIRRHPDDARDLMEDIVNKASGVFLWVVLACRSLLSGFADSDEVHELRSRVEELPPELKEMFQHMVGKVDIRHREEGAYILRTCYSLQRHGWAKRIGSLALALLLQDHVDVRELSTERKRELCRSLEGRLISRCGGLLELRFPTHLNALRGYCCDGCYCGNSYDNHDPYIDSTVGWIHQSVIEFLNDDSVWELDCLRVGEHRPGIAATVSLYELYMAMQAPGPEEKEVLYFSSSIIRGAEADLRDPMDRHNDFGHMEPVLHQLFETEQIDTGASEDIKDSIGGQPGRRPHGSYVGH